VTECKRGKRAEGETRGELLEACIRGSDPEKPARRFFLKSEVDQKMKGSAGYLWNPAYYSKRRLLGKGVETQTSRSRGEE